MLTIPTGSGKSWNGGASKYIDFGARYETGTNDFTVLQMTNQGSLTGQTTCSNFRNTSPRSGFGLEEGWNFAAGAAAGYANLRVINSTSTEKASNSSGSTGLVSGLNDGKDHVIIGRYRNSDGLVWCGADRLSHSQYTTGLTGTITSSQNLMLHRRETIFYTGKSALFLLFQGFLSDAHTQELFENPARVYQAITRRIWITVSAPVSSPIPVFVNHYCNQRMM
jgi:hypothetical protein